MTNVEENPIRTFLWVVAVAAAALFLVSGPEKHAAKKSAKKAAPIVKTGELKPHIQIADSAGARGTVRVDFRTDSTRFESAAAHSPIIDFVQR